MLLMSMKRSIEKETNGRVTVDPIAGQMYYTSDSDGQQHQFHGRLVDRLVNSLREQADTNKTINSLILFADRLSYNPSNDMFTRLYDFLEGAGVEIDEHGFVVCYKKVTNAYRDCFTGTIDNNVGAVPVVDRNQVDEDTNKTCSHGLHVCSAGYLPYYIGDRVMRVRFDPKDAVACPPDHDDAKLRVCRYEVMEELDKELGA